MKIKKNGGYGMTNIKNEIKKAKKGLPYTFVPVKNSDKNKENDKRIVKSVKLNQYNKNLLSGNIKCSLYVLNQLLCGNKRDDENEPAIIKPLIVNNNVIISKHTLKGMLSNFLSAYLKLPIKRINKNKFIYHPNLAFSGKNITTHVGLVDEKSDNVLQIKEIDPPYVFVYDKKNLLDGKQDIDISELTENNYYKYSKIIHIKKTTYGTRLNSNQLMYYEDASGNFTIKDYVNGMDSQGKLAKSHQDVYDAKFAKRHNKFLFQNIEEEPSTEINLSDYDLEKLVDFAKETHGKSHPLSKSSHFEIDKIKENLEQLNNYDKHVNKIIFWEEDKYGTVISFGKTYYYPWAYRKYLNENDFPEDIGRLKDEYLVENDSINLSKVSELFGYSIDKSKVNAKKKPEKEKFSNKSGKIHFNNAVWTNKDEKQYTKKYIKRAGQPKPNAYEFYLKQDLDKNDNAPLNTYGDPARNDEGTRLSGRKMYRRTIKGIENFNECNSSRDATIELNKVIGNNREFPIFKFTINFENLTKKELSLTINGLTLTDNDKNKINTYESGDYLCHQIGYAKNFGMGAVKIFCDEMNIHSYSYNNNGFSSKKITKFHKYISKDFWKKHEILKKICKLSDKKYYYPTKNRNGEVTIPNWHSYIKFNDFKNRRNYFQKQKTGKNKKNEDKKSKESNEDANRVLSQEEVRKDLNL